MAVKVQFQIGHTSKLRSKKTVEGFTHDWELYVKGVQQADISAFVEKIIFNLHESFQKPKRVCNKPPYVIQESGYAGFIVFIDIYFRNRDEPKKVQFNYDLDLQHAGPPHHRHDVKTFIFDNPSEEYRQKLLKGGGVPVSGVMAGAQPIINTNLATIQGVTGINHSPADAHKALGNEGKKHKPRPDDGRSNSFANLFGPPITKTSAVVATGTLTKHSPDNKATIATAHASHPSASGAILPAVKEKSSKDKDKSSEKSKERSEKRDKHHKQSLTSPHKDGRSESKKSDGSKHEKRDKTDEKPKKDKNRDRDKERDREKSSGTNINNSASGTKRPSPKPAREHSPHKTLATGVAPTNVAINNTNSQPRPSSSNSGKLEESKTSSKSSKDSSGEIKSKEPKQKDSSSSSSGKKSKKEKKDKDKEREKEKRHEEKEKIKLAESQQRPGAKEDASKMNNNNNNMNTHTNNSNSLENKNSKPIPNPPLNSNVPNDVIKKPEKLPKPDLFKAVSDKSIVTNAAIAAAVPLVNSSTHSSNEKKSSSNSTLNSNSNPIEKDKRSHKHKKKEKNKDKDKDRDRDKERDKEKDKEKDKDKEREKEKEKDVPKKDKEAKEKHTDEKIAETFSSQQLNTNAGRVLPAPTEQQSNSLNTSVPNATASTTAIGPHTATTAIHSTPSSTTSSKSSKNKEKKSKDKSSSKEEKLKHKINDAETSESKAKQPKLSSGISMHNSSSSSSLSTSSSASSVSTSITNAAKISPNPIQPAVVPPRANNNAEKNFDLSDPDSLPSAAAEQIPPSLINNSTSAKPSQQPSPIITHSESSNSSFPDLQLPKQQPPSKPAPSRERAKSFTAPAAVPPVPLISPASKESSKATKSAVKDKSMNKPPKEEEKEKKKRRNSQAVNTFIEPPVKLLKTKEQPKSTREKSKSPLLRNSGSRASISAEASNTFLQPSASPSSTAAAAPLPPPSTATSASHSPALSAAEAVGNATSATANAATCNSNSASSSAANSTGSAAPHQLPLDYLSELQELHHKIMTLQDNEDLQHVVELIAATGCYEITTKTFDFDLCKLDRGTVQRLQEFFATSVS